MRQRQRRDALALARKLSADGKELLTREIIAPLVPGARIRTAISGVVYEFAPDKPFSGWGCFRPRDERMASRTREALPWERLEYLEQFKPLRILLLWPDEKQKRKGLWWGLPYNEEDARARFRLPYQPLPVLLCDASDGAERFERVIARVDGTALWYGGPDVRAETEHGERLRQASAQEGVSLSGLSHSERQALLLHGLYQIDEARANAQAETSQLESRLRYALGKANATLHSFREMPGTSSILPGVLMVEWSEAGEHVHHYRSTIDRDMTVISSGICLSGQDRKFDLTSLVSVMAASPWHDGEDDDDDW